MPQKITRSSELVDTRKPFFANTRVSFYDANENNRGIDFGELRTLEMIKKKKRDFKKTT